MGKDGYQKVANKKDLQEGSLLKVEPEGKPIVLSLVNGKVYAMDAYQMKPTEALMLLI